MQKIIEKGCFLAKTLMGKEAKKDQERQKKGGGRLLGQGRILGTIRYAAKALASPSSQSP